MTLHNGQYNEKRTKEVIVWPLPDESGDGSVVMDPETRQPTLGPTGQPIRRYGVPDGFTNNPSKNEHGMIVADNYVRQDERGEVIRDQYDAPAAIPEGGALVTHADGHYEILRTPAELAAFEFAHEEA